MLFMNRYYDVIVISNQFYIVTLWQWVEMWNLKISALVYWREYEAWQMTNMTSVLVILKILFRNVFPIFHKNIFNVTEPTDGCNTTRECKQKNKQTDSQTTDVQTKNPERL